MTTPGAGAKKTSRARPKTTKKRPPTATTRKPRGTGWGGDAKGAGTQHPPHDLEGQAGPGRGHASPETLSKREKLERRADEMLDLYYDIATNLGEETPNRLTAAKHLLDRIEGLPVQKIVTADVDPLAMMTDDQLAEHIRQQREIVDKFEKIKKGDQAATP